MKNNKFQTLGLGIGIPFFIITLLFLLFLKEYIEVMAFAYCFIGTILLTILLGLIFSIKALVKNKKYNLSIVMGILLGVFSLAMVVYSAIEINNYVDKTEKMFSDDYDFENLDIDSGPEGIDWEEEMDDAYNE